VADLHRSGRVLVSFAVAQVGGQPTVLGGGGAGLATNPEEPPEERQRRELEEIRRKFQEVGARLGSAFEPASPEDDRHPRAVLPPAPPVEAPARPGWQWIAAAALIFVLGTGFGYLLTRSDAGDPPGTPSAKAAPATRPPATTLAPNPPPVTRLVAPKACLDTARKGDEVFALLSSNVRVNDRRLAEAMKAYTLASQACRKEASP
jgi:hypothetical protein